MPVPYEPPDEDPLLAPPERSPLLDRVSIYPGQEWALDQEKFHHEEALWRFGEYTIFVLLWNAADYKAGRVTHCSTCFTSQGLVAEVYQQPAKRNCPNCFGTTFEGGYRARIVRPAIWNVTETEGDEGPRGQVGTARSTIQTTVDFHWRAGDYAIRADNSRWQITGLDSTYLDTGFEPSVARTAVGYNTASATLEDPSSVAYIIPPTDPVDVAALARQGDHTPHMFADIEDVNGPLLW